MQLDVVTLFPEWFEWFVTQRHVRNVVAAGSELVFLSACGPPDPRRRQNPV